MDDLISRQAAIDALAKFVPYAICDESTESYTNGLTDAYNLICQLPSAQPEQRSFSCGQENDLISRKAAIEALDKRFDSIPMEQTTEILLLRKDLRELPSAQPETNCSEIPNNSDLISRKAAIDALIKRDANCGIDSAEVLKTVPSAQLEPQWIPCSERLPEVDESVLVTTEWNDISIAWRTGIDEWLIHEGNTNATTDDLTAWMPLPEPYKEGDNERA